VGWGGQAASVGQRCPVPFCISMRLDSLASAELVTALHIAPQIVNIPPQRTLRLSLDMWAYPSKGTTSREGVD